MSTRWSIDITPAERAARIVLGAVAAVAGPPQAWATCPHR
jgi:hypothetical protein